MLERQGEDRWMCSYDRFIGESLRRSKPCSEKLISEGIQVEIEPGVLPFDDMGWGPSYGPVISDRLRSLFERIAPGHAEYIPVRFVVEKTLEPVQVPTPYWVMNTLHQVDCIDEAEFKGKIEIESGKDEKWFRDSPWEWLTYRLSSIPSEIKMFRPKHDFLKILIRKEILESLRAEGIKGPLFTVVAYK